MSLIAADQQPRQLYRGYVDEGGDRGWGGRSSEVFVLSGVVVSEDGDRQLRGALDRVNLTLGRDLRTELHWSHNLKEHSQRKFVARTLAATYALSSASSCARPVSLAYQAP